MAKTKVLEVEIREDRGKFLFSGEKKVAKDEYNFDGLSSFKKILSKEKARILDAIKYKKPTSIYNLAKILERPFKAVFDDIKLLERFGVIVLIEEKTKKRIRHKPEIVVDHLIVHVRI